jgi:hypothetical protein
MEHCKTGMQTKQSGMGTLASVKGLALAMLKVPGYQYRVLIVDNILICMLIFIVSCLNFKTRAYERLFRSIPENADTTLFSINFTRFDDSAGVPTLSMMVLFVSSVDSVCNATVDTETCYVHSAVVSDDLVMQNDSITVNLDSMPVVLWTDASRGDSTSARQSEAAGVLAGLEWLGYTYLESNASLDHNETDDSYIWFSNGILPNQYYEANQEDYSSYADCAYQFRNATEDMIRDLHEVVFRFAWYAGNGKAQSNYEYFA